MPKKRNKQKSSRTSGPATSPPVPTHDGTDETDGCSCGCECHEPPSTGMPIHILSEVCHRKGWHEPEYKMTQSANGYLATVSIRGTLPSGEMIVLPFEAPGSLRAAFTDTDESIAKNSIATYVLFCIGEHKHTSDLPRGWRRFLNRELEKTKAVDIKEGRGWMYSPDLFRAYKEQAGSAASK